MNSTTLEEFVIRWGYLAVCMGTFIEGEAVLLAAGALAQKGLLSLPAVLACAFAGSLAWSQMWFQIGRRLGKLGIEARPRWRPRLRKCETWLVRYASGFVVCFRFVVGMSSVSPALLGATGYPMRRFAALDSAGATLWVSLFGCAGWGFAKGVQSLIG